MSPSEIELLLPSLRPDLSVFALRLAPDEREADRLVELTIERARDEAGDVEIDDVRPWLFGLMRNAFHSVERRRSLGRTQRVADRPWNTAQAAMYAATPRIEP